MNAPRAIALCQCFNGALEFQAGNWHEAETALRESIQLYRDIGAASGEALAWQRLGVVQTARGELEAALSSFSEGIVAAERATMRAHCLTRLYASLTRNRLLAGDLAAAQEYLAEGLAMGERHGNCSTCDALLLPVAVSVHLAQGEPARAAEFGRRLAAAAAEYGSRTWIAMADQAQGELLAAQDDVDAALVSYLAAYDGFWATGYVYEAARCLAAIAALRRRRAAAGDQDLAAEAEAKARGLMAGLADAL